MLPADMFDSRIQWRNTPSCTALLCHTQGDRSGRGKGARGRSACLPGRLRDKVREWLDPAVRAGTLQRLHAGLPPLHWNDGPNTAAGHGHGIHQNARQPGNWRRGGRHGSGFEGHAFRRDRPGLHSGRRLDCDANNEDGQAKIAGCEITINDSQTTIINLSGDAAGDDPAVRST